MSNVNSARGSVNMTRPGTQGLSAIGSGRTFGPEPQRCAVDGGSRRGSWTTEYLLAAVARPEQAGRQGEKRWWNAIARRRGQAMWRGGSDRRVLAEDCSLGHRDEGCRGLL